MDKMSGSLITNRLLAGLPTEEWEVLKPRLDHIRMPTRAKLHDGQGAMRTAYFPLSGTVAAFTRFRDGFSHQAIEIGHDGMVGSSIAVGQTRSTAAFEARVPGEGLTLPAMTLARILPDLPTLGRRMTGYVGVVARVLAQNSGCNAHHGLDARLARHLLECVDAAQADSVAMSHEDFAQALCSHRPSVSVAMGRLQRQGLVSQANGSVTLLDRDALEHAACECRGIVREIRNEAADLHGRPGRSSVS